MVRKPLRLALPILVLLGLVPTASADAAKRKVPFGFVGAVLTPDQARLSDALNEQQTSLMARSGVETLRATFAWRAIEPAQNRYNWSSTDRLVAATARHRIALLANVISTPKWASTSRSPIFYSRYAPRDPKLFTDFLQQVVGRYGPNGSFWAANPSIPKTPIRQWQIWNEQITRTFWATRPWPKTYTAFLKAAYRTIHRADRGAKSSPGRSPLSAPTRSGLSPRPVQGPCPPVLRPHLDRSVHDRPEVGQEHDRARVRDPAPRARGDEALRRRAQTHDHHRAVVAVCAGKVAKKRLLGLETTTKGRSARLKNAYAALARNRKKIHVTQAYWFAWATTYNRNAPESDVPYRFSGLTRFTGTAFVPMAPLKVFAATAARLEVCRKGPDARRRL